jgi:hypothetical protein
MKEIEINSSVHGTHKILVDDEDYEFVVQWKWSLKVGGNTFYAHRKDKDNKEIKLHRVLLKLEDPNVVVDHVDGNGLNNQKSNLRACEHTNNKRNRRIDNKQTLSSTSKYKGVCWRSDTEKWSAQLHLDGKKVHLGSFPKNCEIIGAYAYDVAAIKNFGEFACLNFPDSINRLDELEFLVDKHRIIVEKRRNYPGVTFYKPGNKWVAVYKRKHIGYFETEEKAYLAQQEYVRCLGDN